MNDSSIREQIKNLALQKGFTMINIDQLMKDANGDEDSLVENIKIHINKKPRRKKKRNITYI